MSPSLFIMLFSPLLSHFHLSDLFFFLPHATFNAGGVDNSFLSRASKNLPHESEVHITDPQNPTPLSTGAPTNNKSVLQQ